MDDRDFLIPTVNLCTASQVFLGQLVPCCNRFPVALINAQLSFKRPALTTVGKYDSSANAADPPNASVPKVMVHLMPVFLDW
jgi:hypothetical protein